MGAFKAYDIRGKYPDEVNVLLAEKVGLVLPDITSCDKVVVGRDMRTSSEKLQEALMKGLIKRGIEVYDIGLVSTPKLYFASFFFDFPAGIMVTASHNPKEYNGFKVVRRDAAALDYETGLHQMENRIREGKWTESKHPGEIIPLDVSLEYDLYLKKFILYNKPLNIVLDAGNGMGIVEFPKVPSKTQVEINKEPNGAFPKYTPNPILEENRKEIIKQVKKNKADIGISFDGDVDRVVFIDENAEYIHADHIFALLIEQVCTKGDVVVCELNLSKVVDEVAAKQGVKVIRTRVGRSYVCRTMRTNDARLGAEASGHFYFRENRYSDSGTLAAIFVLNVLGRSDKKLSELIQPFKKYYSQEENFKVDNKKKALGEIEKSFEGKKEKLDGISIHTPEVWFNVRPSNTESLLRFRAEGITKKSVDDLLKEVKAILK